MLHRSRAAACEPCFDPPPRLAPVPDRRLAVRAAAAAAANRGLHDFRDNAVSLQRAGDGFVVTAVGAAIAAGFGTAPGPLAGLPGSLAALLAEAGTASCGADAVVPFEAAVATPFAACVLLRGVVLPTADGVEAVFSWKQVLDDDATARIRAELLRELRPQPRAVPARDAFL